jgi:hypothetical protein
MRLRRFTSSGLSRFEEFLSEARARRVTEFPHEILVQRGLAEDLGAAVDLEPSELDGTRLQAAGVLHERLLAAGLADPERDAALWAWLSALLFEVVCPRDRQRRFRPGRDACYVPVLGVARLTHRHRLLGPFLIFRAHRDDPYRALCLLSQPLRRPGRLVDCLTSRARLVACPAAVGVATRLYCDRSNAIRRGAAASVERLSDVLMQLDRTYDIYGMTVDALLALLPREFDAFQKR